MRRAVLFSESSSNIGGQELQALAQMEGLRRRGIETLLVCRPGSAIGGEAQSRGLPCAFAALRSAGDLWSAVVLRRCIARLAPAAVICHSGHDAYLAGLATKLGRLHPPRLIRMRTYKSSVNRFMYDRVFDLALTPSAFMREEL